MARAFPRQAKLPAHSHQDTLPCPSTLLWFPLPGSDNFFQDSSVMLCATPAVLSLSSLYQHPSAQACKRRLEAPRHRTLPKLMDSLSETPSITGQTDISMGHHSGYREAKHCGETCFPTRGWAGHQQWALQEHQKLLLPTHWFSHLCFALQLFLKSASGFRKMPYENLGSSQSAVPLDGHGKENHGRRELLKEDKGRCLSPNGQ